LTSEGLGDVARKVGDVAKKVGSKVLDKLGHEDDVLKDLQQKAGVPAYAQHGKPNMAYPKDEKQLDEFDIDTLNQLASHPMAGPLAAAGGAAIGATIGKGITKAADWYKNRQEKKAGDQAAEKDLEESLMRQLANFKK